MAENIKIDALMGHAMTKALFTGDVDALVELLAQYLAANGLKLTGAHIEELSRAGVIETQ